MTLVSLVTLYFLLMTGLCIFGIVGLYKVSSSFSAFNTLAYPDVSVLESFLWYLKSDVFGFLIGLALSPSSGIKCTRILFSVSYVEVLFFSIPGTKLSPCVSYNIFRIYTGSVIFHSAHLSSLVMMNLLVSVLYNVYVYLVWLSTYPTIIALYILSVIFFLILSPLVT